MLEIRTLGGLSILKDGHPLKDLGSHKAEALLVYLAVERGEHGRNRLATLLWPESPQERAQTSLRVVLSTLRERLGDYLDITREAVGLASVAEVDVDVAELERKLSDGLAAEAVPLYRGDFLVGFQVRGSPEFETWVVWEQERYRRLVVQALHSLLVLATERGQLREGQALARQLLAIDPLDEFGHRQLMLLLALDGQRSEALIQYEKCRRQLREDLGVDPTQETRDLFGRIARGELSERELPHPPEHNLPTQRTSFVDREAELDQLADCLRDPSRRLVTLLGPGGAGKTRLALQAAAASLSCYPDGTYFVPLGAISSPEEIVPAMAAALRFPIDSIASKLDAKGQLLDYLRQRAVLLVLDGFEHLLGAAELLAALLEGASQLKLLVTSRERLNLQGEWVVPVAGLPVPQVGEERIEEAGALALFVDRALQARPGFVVSGREREHAVRICRLTEGFPLGIELAAAWVPMLSCAEIGEEITKSLDFLSTSGRDVPEKQRSLRASFEHSWRLLSGEQRDVFGRLSVFQGGFEREAAERVAGARLADLAALVDKSLLHRDLSGRLRLHELLRQFASERLAEGQRDMISESHARFYVGYLAQREEQLMGPRILQVRGEIRKELENVRAAVTWAVVHWEEREARKALAGLMTLFMVHGWHEGRDAFERLIRIVQEKRAQGEIDDPTASRIFLAARVRQAFFSANLSMTAESEAISRESLAALREQGLQEELSICLQNLGVDATLRGEYDPAAEFLDEAIALGRESHCVAWPTFLLWRGWIHFELGDYDRAMKDFREVLATYERLGSPWGKAFTLSKMGTAADGLRQYSQALQYHQESLAIFRELGDRAGQAYGLSRMSLAAYARGEYEDGIRFGQEGLAIFRDLAHRWGICTSYCRLGFAYLGIGQIQEAEARLVEALVQSQENQIDPLTLYALAGLACLMAQQGDEAEGRQLYDFVRSHPRTPAVYVDMAAGWFPDRGEIPPAKGATALGAPTEMEALSDVAARVLKARRAKASPARHGG